MRLKFQKVPALLLSAAMALTPATGVLAEEASNTPVAQTTVEPAYQWVEGDNGSQAWFDWDSEKHTATVSYTLKDITTGAWKTFGPFNATMKLGYPKNPTCTEGAKDCFVFTAELGAAGNEQKKGLESKEYEYGKPNGHKYGDWIRDDEKVVPATCTSAGTMAWKRVCSVCGDEEYKTEPLAQLEHVKLDQNGNFVGYTDRVYLAGYTHLQNVVFEEGETWNSLRKDADGVFDGCNDPSHPVQDRPEFPYSFDLVYKCQYCNWTDYVTDAHDPIAVLEGEPEINVMSINNLYFVVENEYTALNPNDLIDNCDLSGYPVSGTMKNVQEIDGAYTGRIMNNDGVRLTPNADGTYNKDDVRLVDCTKDGSYDIVRYAKNSDGSWMVDSAGHRIIARVVSTVKIEAGHQMTNPTVKDKYRCTTTEGYDADGNWVITAVPTTCTEGWYKTYSKCQNPNCKYDDTQKVTVTGDEKLHQYPDKWTLALDTQNCYNYGKQTYEKACTLCGHVTTRTEDHTDMLKDERKSHRYGTPTLVEWLVEPTCTEPGKYLSHESCVNEWYNEDGTTYVCGHEQETEVVVKALGHTSTEKLEWTGTVVVNNDQTPLKPGYIYKYNKKNYRLANAEIVSICDRCGEETARVDVKEIRVVSIEDETETACAPGTIVLKATYSINGGDEQTDEHSFNYYSTMEAYRGKMDHVWDVESMRTTEPTCTEDGEEVVTRTCKLCGTVEEVSVNVIPKTGHVAGETKVENGNLVTYCKVCGEPYLTVPVADPVVDFVDRMYDTVLNRTPDEGADYWAQTLKAGAQTGAGVAVAFFTGEEYIGRNKTDSEYLNDLYVAIMGRNADAAGKAHWQSILNQGYSRNYVLEKFIGSREFRDICEEYGIKAGAYASTEAVDVQMKNVTGFVTRLYETCMGRTPDPTGLNYWVKALVSGKATGTQTVVHFCNSAEFQAKNLSDSEFVTLLYTAVMGRNAEASGVEYWAGQIAKGATRTSVVESFAKSAEFGRICAGYGITR